MWEAIRANRRRSRLLIGLMGSLLVGVGAVAAAALAGPEMAWAGGLLALGIWGILLALALFKGDELALMATRARRLRKEDAPQLWNVTEEMAIAAGLPMPRLYLIDDDAPNAFATASRKGPAAVAVTAGLLRRLTRDELQGVIAHEIGHIRNKDVQFMTIALVMVGSIALVSDMALYILWFGGGRRRGGGKSGGQAQILLLALTVLAAILAPVFARLLYFACSRQREYLADASAARFSRYPAGLASALEKISRNQTGSRGRQMRAMAPLYIVNPLAASAAGLFSSHPPTRRRVEILRAMGGAGWVDYEKAYGQVVGDRTPCLDKETLASEGSISTRQGQVIPAAEADATRRKREVTDLLDRMAHFLLVPCLCGVRIKVPPAFKGDQVKCPRCGRDHVIPTAQGEPAAIGAALAGAIAMGTAATGAAATGSSPASRAGTPMSYRRKGNSWESFRCSCGRTLQLSPAFEARRLRCKGCGQSIEIQPA
ncbi:MAG: peptidase M28 [Acidobacteria bacterium]|nr:MAG: peptidase M28 [Acidobacteriota bacterium]